MMYVEEKGISVKKFDREKEFRIREYQKKYAHINLNEPDPEDIPIDKSRVVVNMTTGIAYRNAAVAARILKTPYSGVYKACGTNHVRLHKEKWAYLKPTMLKSLVNGLDIHEDRVIMKPDRLDIRDLLHDAYTNRR